MYDGTLDHGKIINAFLRSVPGSYVRDYRDNGGYITVCRDYKDMPWNDQTTTRNVYRQVPAVTLLNLPRGTVTARTRFHGLRMSRPGWMQEFRRAMSKLTYSQMRRITKMLGVGEVFPENR